MPDPLTKLTEAQPFGAIRPAAQLRTIATIATGVFSTTGPCRALWIEVGGLLVLTAGEDAAEVEMNVGSLFMLPVSVSDLSSKTTCTGLTALF